MKCDYCIKDAVANYQKLWMRWAIKRGDYSKTPSYDHRAKELTDRDEPTGENNLHVCADHETQLVNGDI